MWLLLPGGVPAISMKPNTLAYRCGVALGAVIGGGQVGPMLRRVAFAAALRDVLAATA